MDLKPFQPKAGGTIAVANATSASTPALLDPTCDQVVITNTSATATAYWRCQAIWADSDTVASADAAKDFPILPASQIRLTVGEGRKKFSVVASAADGSTLVTPGKGF